MIHAVIISRNVPPPFEEVKIYFNQRGIPEIEATQFFLFYELKRWTNKKGNAYKSWKTIAYQWILGVLINQPELFDKQIH